METLIYLFKREYDEALSRAHREGDWKGVARWKLRYSCACVGVGRERPPRKCRVEKSFPSSFSSSDAVARFSRSHRDTRKPRKAFFLSCELFSSTVALCCKSWSALIRPDLSTGEVQRKLFLATCLTAASLRPSLRQSLFRQQQHLEGFFFCFTEIFHATLAGLECVRRSGVRERRGEGKEGKKVGNWKGERKNSPKPASRRNRF